MVKRVQIILTDDLDDSVAAETVTFGLDGQTYEIDLSAENASTLRKTLAPYIERGRKARTRPRGTTTPVRRSSESTTNQVRAWAEAQGMPVSARGRISAKVREAYEAANR